MRPPYRCILRIGAWQTAVSAPCAFHCSLIAFLQKRNVFPCPAEEWAGAARTLNIVRAPLDIPWRLDTLAPDRWELTLPPQSTRCAHVLMTAMDQSIHQLLFDEQLIVLHASAVRLEGKTCLFLGERGSGKTTTALRLGASGGLILADDRVVLSQRDGVLMVSGCNSTARVTAKTEAGLFASVLEGPQRNFHGLPKKEIDLNGRFPVQPHIEYPVHRLYFPKLGSGLQSRPLDRTQSLLKLVELTRSMWKYASPAQTRALLARLGELVNTTTSYNLDLSFDISDSRALLEELRR
jgi:hypothetical protein